MKTSVLASSIAAVALSTASSATFTYTPATGSTTWSSSAGWSAAPVSATDTTLVFGNGAVTDGTANTNTNDVANPFQFNVLTLSGTGSANASTIAIGGSALSSAGTTPQVNLTATGPGLTYTVNPGVHLGANTTFAGNGTASFNFAGGISGSDYTFTKTGTAAMTLGTTTVKNLAVGLNAVGGTVTMAAGSNLTVGSGASDSFMLSSNTSPSNVVTSGVLNASAASNVTVDVGIFSVGSILGGNPASPTTATLNLGANNSIKAATSLLLGVSTVNPAIGSAHFLTTADGSTTTVETPLMRVGGLKGGGTFTVGDGASLTVGGVSGGRTALSIGTWTEVILSGAGADSSLNVSEGVFSGKLSSLHLGSLTAGGTAVTVSGTMLLSDNAANHLDISGTGNVVVIGRNSTTSGSFGSLVGTLTIGNLDATSSITSTDNSTAILIGTQGPTQTTAAKWATGTLNLNGGTVTITTTGSAIAGGFAENPLNDSAVNFNGTTIKAGAANAVAGKWITNLKTANIGAGGAKFDSNGFDISTDQVFSGSGSLTKLGAGVLTLLGANTYTGATIVDEGVLKLGAAGVIANASSLTLNGGTLDLDGFSETMGTLTLGATSLLDFGTLLGGANTVTFADSSAVVWSGSLILVDYEVGIDFLNFGNAGGLTFAQLNSISLSGFTATGLDEMGNVIFAPVPEPAEFAMAIAAGLGLLAFIRRRRAFRNA